MEILLKYVILKLTFIGYNNNFIAESILRSKVQPVLLVRLQQRHGEIQKLSDRWLTLYIL